jgi:hypothetical protein
MGIRSARFLLAQGRYAVSTSPRTVVSAAVLTAILRGANHDREEPSPDRATAWQTWLGLRYDRPAVPDELIPLAKQISEEIKKKQRRPTVDLVRDVLMQFDSSTAPPRFSLFAVLADAADVPVVREWLAAIALAISPELGIGDTFEAAHADQVSLTLIETSYSADVTQLTWSGADGPRGAC